MIREVEAYLGDVAFPPYPLTPPALAHTERREEFLQYIRATDMSGRDGTHSLTLHGSRLTFDFKDKLSGNEVVTTMLRLSGLSFSEIADVRQKGGVSTHSDLYARARRRCGVPEGHNFALFAYDKKYISYDQTTELADPDLAMVSFSLLRRLADPGVTVEKISQKFTQRRVARFLLDSVARTTYNSIGVTNADEAILSLGTHGLLKNKYDRRTEEPVIYDQLYNQLSNDLHRRTITFNGMELGVNFGSDFLGKKGGLALMLAFGMSFKAVAPNIKGRTYTQRKTMNNLCGQLGVTRVDRAQGVRGFIDRYIEITDGQHYMRPSGYQMTSNDLGLINQISRKTKQEIHEETGIARHEIDAKLRELREKMQVENDALLVWTALLEGRL